MTLIEYNLQGDSNSADLGACYRVKHALYGEGRPFDQFIQSVQAYQKVWDPNKDAKEVRKKTVNFCKTKRQFILIFF